MNKKILVFSIPFIVFLLSIITTFYWWEAEKNTLAEKEEKNFINISKQFNTQLIGRLREYEDVLRGLKGLFSAYGDVESTKFEAYVVNLDLKTRFPNIKAIEYIAVRDNENIIAESVTSTSSEAEIFDINKIPSLPLYTDTNKATPYVLEYIVPLKDNEDAIGYDFGSDQMRLTAMEYARDENSLSISSPVKLVTGEEGILFMHPVYDNKQPIATKEERQHALKGFVVAAITVDQFIAAMDTSDFSDIMLTYSDTTDVDLAEPEIIYRSPNRFNAEDSHYTRTESIRFANREWTGEYQSLPTLRVDEAAENVPTRTLIFGMIGSVLIFLFVFSLVYGRHRALLLVEIRTKELQETTNRLTLATKSAGIGIWEYDLVKNIFLWDEEMYQLYGTKEEDFKGTYNEWLSFIHPEDKETTSEIIKNALSNSSIFDTNFRVIRPDEVTRYIKTRAIIERNKNKEPILMIGVSIDVTHEMEVDKAKTEFVSLASHQLRTPLSAIGWFSQMLISGDAGELNSEQAIFVKQIEESNQRMVKLVDSLLDVSRIDLGTFAIDPEMVVLREIADNVIHENEQKVIEKNQLVNKIYKNDVPEIMADPHLTYIIFQNLISNAIKYTGNNGKIVVSIEKEKDNVHISVSDTGCGIPKSQQNHIFEKLFRADNVREMETDGTGLGLYIIKSITEAVSGKIWFDSKEGKGTTFHVTLPLAGMRRKIGKKGLN